MTNPLSPAAQAILDTANNVRVDVDWWPEGLSEIVAAALRAAAKHCVPDDSEGHWVYIPNVLAIADELESL